MNLFDFLYRNQEKPNKTVKKQNSKKCKAKRKFKTKKQVEKKNAKTCK